MTSAQQQTYHTQYLRWNTQQERSMVRLVRARMGKMADGLILALSKSNPDGTLALLNLYVSLSAHESLLQAIYIQVGVAAAEREYNRIMPPAKANQEAVKLKDRDKPGSGQSSKPSSLIQLNFNSEKWRQTMVALARSSETAQRISDITEKTRQLVRDVFAESASQRWSLPKLVKGIRTVLVDKKRARLIARTETTRAANAGHEAGAQTTLLVLNKVWIATNDSRTRDLHRAMLGAKPVPRDGKFTVGGKEMKYPGDPAGGAENVCNCRCTVAYVPADVNYD
ncbi:hypothetical protein GCM10028807_57970 [Spirosoma daeguense]